MRHPSISPLRIAVIGVGHLGQHHARILADTRDVSLVGVVDINEARAREIAAQYGTTAYTDASQVLGLVDAVSIAAPTVAHVETALPFVERGIPVLVEKPLAASLADADRLLEAAASRGVPIAVGHTERFNPAVTAAKPIVKRPRFVEAHRLGVFPERSLDIDVVFDLMIHDIDVLLSLVGSDVASVEAVGVNVLTPKPDIANARIRFVNGCVANLTASRISRERVRKIRFFQPDAYVSIDYGARELEVYRLVPPSAGPVGRPAIQGGKIECAKDEPLRLELEDFVSAVRDGRTPAVNGAAGRAALALATTISEQMQATAG